MENTLSKDRLKVLNYHLDKWWDHKISCARFDTDIELTDEWIAKNAKDLSDEEKAILKLHIDNSKTKIEF